MFRRVGKVKRDKGYGPYSVLWVVGESVAYGGVRGSRATQSFEDQLDRADAASWQIDLQPFSGCNAQLQRAGCNAHIDVRALS